MCFVCLNHVRIKYKHCILNDRVDFFLNVSGCCFNDHILVKIYVCKKENDRDLVCSVYTPHLGDHNNGCLCQTYMRRFSNILC
jgi:hypothetical protein